jgi:ssDNA-binding Zn-finger/Zn-ribbon topoisomerase 1
MERVVVKSDIKCPNCGRDMVVRTSRFGKQFLGCQGYPECKTMLPLDGGAPIEPPKDEETDYKCEKCGHAYVPKYKSVFLSMHAGRTRYMKCPKCNEKSWQKKVISKDK